MTAALELGSIVLCFLIPGTVVLRLVRPPVDTVGGFAFAAGISLLANHLIIFGLTMLGLYAAWPIRITAIIVLIPFLLVVFRKTQDNPTSPGRDAAAQPTRLFELLGTLLAIFALAFAIGRFAKLAWDDFGSIMNIWDDIVSWNRWALEWFKGHIPLDSKEYPQLLPSLWSMIYLIGGTSDLQFFVKAMMAWLPVLVFVGFIAMWREERGAAAVIAALAAVQIFIIIAPWATAAYADVPTGTIAFLGFYAGWISTRRSRTDADKLAWVGAALVGAATLTKGTGWFFAGSYFLYLWLLSPKDPAIWRRLGVGIAITTLIALPWWAHREILILHGTDHSAALALAVTIHGGRGVVERFRESLSIASGLLGGGAWRWLPFSVPQAVQIPTYWVALAGCLLALGSKLGRVVVLLSVLPYSLIYALIFGYDVRNLLPVIPFLAWAIGIGGGNLWRGCQFAFRPIIGKLNPVVWHRSVAAAPHLSIRGVAILGVSLVAVIATSMVFWARSWPTEDFLRAQQTAALWRLGDAKLNQELYDYLRNHPETRLIATPYQLISVIPILKEHYAFEPLKSVDELDWVISSRPVDLILDRGVYVSPAVRAELDARERKGALVRERSGSEWRLFRVPRSSIK